MLSELTGQFVTLIQSHLALFVLLCDFMIKSLLLVSMAKYYESARSPFFSNSQKRDLWLAVLLLLGMLPIAAFIDSNMLSKTYSSPNLNLVTLLVTPELAGTSISNDQYFDSLLQPLLSLYLIVLLFPLGQLTASLRHICMIHRRATFDAPLEAIERLDRLRGELGISRSIKIARAEFLSSPMTYGTLSPTIVLPSSTYYEDESLLENVLIHELGHIKRFDHITYITCYLVASLNWFNPLIWHSLKKLGLESEYACDNEVLEQNNSPIEFASQLLKIARCELRTQSSPLACRSIITRGELSLRIEHILQNNVGLQNGKKHSSSLPIAMLMLVFVLASTGKILALENERNYASEDLRLISSEIPEYPDAALKKGAKGFAQFSFSVDALGRIDPQSIVLKKSEPHLLFESSSLAALNSFVFSPRKVNGKRVSTSHVHYTFEFDIRI